MTLEERLEFIEEGGGGRCDLCTKNLDLRIFGGLQFGHAGFLGLHGVSHLQSRIQSGPLLRIQISLQHLTGLEALGNHLGIGVGHHELLGKEIVFTSPSIQNLLVETIAAVLVSNSLELVLKILIGLQQAIIGLAKLAVFAAVLHQGSNFAILILLQIGPIEDLIHAELQIGHGLRPHFCVRAAVIVQLHGIIGELLTALAQHLNVTLLPGLLAADLEEVLQNGQYLLTHIEVSLDRMTNCPYILGYFSASLLGRPQDAFLGYPCTNSIHLFFHL